MLHHLSIRRCLTALVVLWIVGPAFAQHDNPVYVDDSKRAWEQFRLAAEQREDNLGESVRLYQSLLDDFTFALIPSHTMSQDHFRAVRSRVLDVLRRDDELLARYQEMNGPEAERLLTAGERRAVAVRFALTDAGLDAQLRLAQDLLEQGHFRRAMTWLDEAERHPMLTRADERHVILMSATAARYLGDLATLTRLAARVHQPESPFTDLRATMNTMLDLTVAPAMPSGRRTLDVLETSDLQDLVAQAIWENALSDSLLHRQTSQLSTSGIGSDSQLTDRWLDADLLTSMLTVTDDDVFVNEGHQIHAYNRLTGRWLWTFDDRRRRSSMLTYENEPTLDLNAIAVGEGALVTLTGYAYASKRSGEGGVLCLDPATGAQRWRMVLSDDDLPEVDDGDDLFPHGAPVIHEGSAYILARRVNKQFLTSTYVVALDLQTGEPRWARHICSSAALRRVGRIMSTLTLDAGDVFVATPVGALARLDAGTGELRWLHRFSVPITGTATTRVHRPWEVSAPLVVDGRVIALQPDLSRIVALDRVTGDVIDSHECRSIDLWNSPAYLLSDGFYLYGIGEDIRASRVDMLDSLAWQYPPPQQQMSPTEQPSRTALNLRGRVQLVNEAMIVPTLDAMTILDAETGVELHALDMPGIGNPLAADAQLLLVDGQRLRSYMPFERAEQMLRRRIASNPTDPGPALSLLRLGVRVEDIGIVLESGATVLRIVENHDDFASTRQELFEELQRDDAIELAVAAADGERLFELTEALTDTPEQFVRHALAHSDWLSNINPSRSLAGYHDLLAGTAHAEVPIREGDVRRPTRAIVIDRLFDLRARHGEALFRSIDETAQDRLAAIMPGDESEADVFALDWVPELPEEGGFQTGVAHPFSHPFDRGGSGSVFSLPVERLSGPVVNHPDAVAAEVPEGVVDSIMVTLPANLCNVLPVTLDQLVGEGEAVVLDICPIGGLRAGPLDEVDQRQQ